MRDIVYRSSASKKSVTWAKKHSCAYKDNFDILPNVECEIFTLSSLLNGHKFQANIIISTGWFYSNSYAYLGSNAKYLHWTAPTTQRDWFNCLCGFRGSHMRAWTVLNSILCAMEKYALRVREKIYIFNILLWVWRVF